MKEYRLIYYGIVSGLLLIGFLLLFGRIRWLEAMERMLRQTRVGVEEISRHRLLEKRRKLLTLQRSDTLWYCLEQELHYSGWKRRLGFVTAELWIVGNIMLTVLLLAVGLLLAGTWLWGVIFVLAVWGMEGIFLWLCKLKEMQSVNDNLLKFLNFLGNYSITAGEITGIFKQVSRYMEEPLKSALAECSYEAQVTGDVSGALLSMAEKIEHPKFKELARNMEISVRYCANFTVLVASSRKSVREYLRLYEERKGMLYEAMVNMVVLLGMSIFSLMTVDKLVTVSVWEILWHTLPGQGALLIVGTTLVLFVGQFYRISK